MTKSVGITGTEKEKAEYQPAVRVHQTLYRNFRIRNGQVDLVTLKSGKVYFLGVKTWVKNAENLKYAVNSHRQSCLCKTAKSALASNRKAEEYTKQYNLVLVNRTYKSLEYIPHAFEGGER